MTSPMKLSKIIGGTSIGFAIAEAYAKAGAKIAFNCRSQHHMDQAGGRWLNGYSDHLPVVMYLVKEKVENGRESSF